MHDIISISLNGTDKPQMAEEEGDGQQSSANGRLNCTFAANSVGFPVIGKEVGRMRSSDYQMLHVPPGQVFTGTEVHMHTQ